MTLDELNIEVKPQDNYVTTCPECSNGRRAENRRKPCLSVKRVNGGEYAVFNCHNCGYSGCTKDYERYKEVREASKMPKTKPTIYSKEVSSWLASKQITPETALKCSCYEYSNELGKTFCFPYNLRGNIVNVMFRKMADGAKKVWQIPKDKGAVSCFWGLEMLDLNVKNEIIITEGQTDRMTWVQCEYGNVLSIPMGAPNPNAQNTEKLLEYVTDPYIVKLFEEVDKFYLATDNDANGIFLRDLLADKLGKDRCYILNYPKGYKDSNEVYAGDAKKDLEPKGKSGIEYMYTNARPYPIRGVIRVSDVRDKIMLFRKGGFKKGLICGHPDIDKYISFKTKILTVLTGISGMGKSSWNRWYLIELCKINPDLKFVLYTPESRPVEREYVKMAEIMAMGAIQENYTNSMSDIQLDKALEWIERHFILVNPDDKNFFKFGKEHGNKSPKALNSILDYVLYLKKTQGVSGFLIDAWNKLDHQRDAKLSETDFISRELDRILNFLEIEDVAGTIIAHPTKMERKPSKNYREPGLYDIKGSSAWYEKADIGIVIHRDKWAKTDKKNKNDEYIYEIDNNASSKFICEKMKFDELGMEGETEMWMDRKHGDRFVFEDPYGNSYEAKKEKEKKKQIVLPIETPSLGGLTDDLPF